MFRALKLSPLYQKYCLKMNRHVPDHLRLVFR